MQTLSRAAADRDWAYALAWLHLEIVKLKRGLFGADSA